MTPTEPTSGNRPLTDAQQRSLYASLVEDAFDFMVAVRSDLTVAFASGGIVERLGRPAEAYLERSIVDFVHPQDLERAILHMDGWEQGADQGGTTTFRLLLPDATYRPFDVTAAQVTDGDQTYLAVYCRPVDYKLATDEVLAQLLRGGSRAAALRPVLDVFSWEVNNTFISIAWHDPETGHDFVSNGLPRNLTGAADHPGRAWQLARAEGQPVLDIDRSLLEPELGEQADALGRGSYWVVPVPDAGSHLPALVTVWADPAFGRPDAHAYGMTMAHTYIELILRWSQHLEALQTAASRDPLTGLANRTALFHALDSGTSRGALLFCDLDRFKPVNDEHGHAAGDHVLRQTARRIEGAVRAGDLVARTGGDEFVVLAPDITPEQAAALAERILAVVAEPTELPSGTVAVGVTIGVAHADDALTEATLLGADQALMLAKASAGGTVRWAPGPRPHDATTAGEPAAQREAVSPVTSTE